MWPAQICTGAAVAKQVLVGHGAQLAAQFFEIE
jgi:hypothetical protein